MIVFNCLSTILADSEFLHVGDLSAALIWQHDCAHEQTQFSLVGLSKGWFGVGFIGAKAFNQSQAMKNVSLLLDF